MKILSLLEKSPLMKGKYQSYSHLPVLLTLSKIYKWSSTLKNINHFRPEFTLHHQVECSIQHFSKYVFEGNLKCNKWPNQFFRIQI